ncbi:MAG: O-antigen ligase family protein [Pseudomonadota bacterium]
MKTMALNFRKHDLTRRLLLFIAVLLSGGGLYFPRAVLALGFAAFILVYFPRFKLSLRRENRNIHLWILAIVGMFLLRFSWPEASSIVMRLSNFFIGLALLHIYYRDHGDTLIPDLIWMLRPMAWQAVLTPLVYLLLPFVFLDVPIGEQQFKTAFLIFNFHAVLADGGMLVRPDGFFWEPGVFQLYLNIFLFLSLFIVRNNKYALLALLGVGATQSTTGLVIAGFLMGAATLDRLNAKRPGSKWQALLVIALVVPIAAGFIYNNLVEKVEGSGHGSTLIREFDLMTGINIIQEYPWMGIGFSKDNYLAAAGSYGFFESELGEEYLEERAGTSNGLVQLLYSIGIPLGLFSLFCVYRQTLMPHRFIFGTLIALTLFGEALGFTPFILMFIFSGMQRRAPRPLPARALSPVPCNE